MKRFLFFILFVSFAVTFFAQTPSITVTSPNGGENWAIGSTHNITWNYTNLTGNVRIQLIRANSSMTTVATIVNETPIENRFFSWTIPSTVLPGVDYKIHIVWVSMLTVYFGDVSDGSFSISGTSPSPTLTVLSPNGGENWVIGSTHPITWTSTNLAGNVKIMLVGLNTTTPATVIAGSVPVLDGSFTWTIPNSIIPSSNYRILISSLASTTDPVSGGCFDYSDNVFSIMGGGSFPSLRVLSPNGGENWTIGSSRTIRWTSSFLTGSVMIQLVRGQQNEVVLDIASDVSVLRGYYLWTVPTVVTGNDYKIKITSLDPGPTFAPIFDLSDQYFRISTSSTPRLTLLSPNGGERWESGSTHPITWNYQNLTGTVSLFLIRNNTTAVTPINSPVILIASNIPVENSVYNWTIPASIPQGRFYKVRIISSFPSVSTVMTISDLSDDFFAITSPITIEVQTNPGQAGSSIELYSPAAAVGSVKIFNLRGQLIKILLNDGVIEGRKSIFWDGRNEENRKVSMGMYFVRISTEQSQYTKRLIMH